MLPRQQSHLEHLEADGEVFSSSVFPAYPPVLLLQADQHLLLSASHLERELEKTNTEGVKDEGFNVTLEVSVASPVGCAETCPCG